MIGLRARKRWSIGSVGAVLALAIAAQVLFASGALAQLRGTVSTTAGRPLSTVLVELWRGSTQSGSRVTDSMGRFGFAKAETNGATELWARRIGFAARRVLLARGDTVLDIRLAGMADATTVEVMARIDAACPNQEESEARSLWQSMRRRYRSADSVGLATGFSVSNTVVGRDDLGITGRLAEPKGRRALPGTSRIAWRKRIVAEGYAWMLEYRGDGYASKMWEYPPLESDFTQHFIDHVFGRMHRLSLVSKHDGEQIIAFCPADSRLPALNGLLVLSADTTLVRAVWRLRTPEPVEVSGGEALFTAYDARAGIPILLPRRGLFWRALPSGEYHQRWQIYDGWATEGERMSLAEEDP